MAKDLMETKNEYFSVYLYEKAGERLSKFCHWNQYAAWFGFNKNRVDDYGRLDKQSKIIYNL